MIYSFYKHINCKHELTLYQRIFFCKVDVRKQICDAALSFWYSELKEEMENLQKLFGCK